jgi:hypothetical protein
MPELEEIACIVMHPMKLHSMPGASSALSCICCKPLLAGWRV